MNEKKSWGIGVGVIAILTLGISSFVFREALGNFINTGKLYTTQSTFEESNYNSVTEAWNDLAEETFEPLTIDDIEFIYLSDITSQELNSYKIKACFNRLLTAKEEESIQFGYTYILDIKDDHIQDKSEKEIKKVGRIYPGTEVNDCFDVENTRSIDQITSSFREPREKFYVKSVEVNLFLCPVKTNSLNCSSNVKKDSKEEDNLKLGTGKINYISF